MRRRKRRFVFESENRAERISFLAGGTFSGQKVRISCGPEVLENIQNSMTKVGKVAKRVA
jgi:hypothetical protein